MKFLVLHGPNMNLLGKRQPEIYGTQTLEDLYCYLTSVAHEKGIELSFLQSNHEGVLIDTLQQAPQHYDAVIFNPAAYAHYSIALRDCIAAIEIPVAEVHISDISNREFFRHESITAKPCVYFTAGKGFQGYKDALIYVKEELL